MAIRLNSGFNIPIVGLGVWRMEGKTIKDLIIDSINLGYRHLDCAANYGGNTQRRLKIDYDGNLRLYTRHNSSEKRWVVSWQVFSDSCKIHGQCGLNSLCSYDIKSGMLWNSDHGHVLEACKDSLKKLHLDYLDLYLVHFPVATKHTGVGTTKTTLDEDGVLEIDTTISLETTWHAMEELVSMGLVRSIGISNYGVVLTRDCLAYSKIKPAVNQIETHPYFQRDSLVKFCQKHGVFVTAHTPLGGATANTELFGSISCLDDPILQDLARKYNKSVAQIVLRWGIQRNTAVIPKTSKVKRLKDNFQVFDFELTKEDMDLIKTLDKELRTNQPAK
ncbi:hypothetical protein G4B88_021955 [Cannabis sativa]|uniref:NADP-dependent oxidoreductase domain-containing protein n=1 Tax=Cannabis sativa TaxID=3483 RepID=A0A7J6FZW3_CANSA|nr:hypothetical protein G4B88_021955 [Cannabis sativa]